MNSRLEIRLSQDNLDLIKRTAQSHGMNLSEFVRRAALALALVKNPERANVVLLDTLTWHQIKWEMHRHGVNLNQATRALNRIALRLGSDPLYAEEADVIEECKEAAEEIRLRADEMLFGYDEIAAKFESIKDKACILRER